MEPQISIIVPCLNEEQNIPSLLNKLTGLIDGLGVSVEILIVDDCSDDYTFREAFIYSQQEGRVRALHKGLPRGIGNAIKFGIQHARGIMGVVVMGDLVDPLDKIADFRKKIIEEGYHLCLLSRYLEPGDYKDIPFSYKFYQWGFRWLSRLLVGIKFKDITYAYRAFNLNYIRQLNLSSARFEISPEISFKVFLSGGRICEVKGRQGKRTAGQSKFLFSKAGLGYSRVLLRAALTRLLRAKKSPFFK